MQMLNMVSFSSLLSAFLLRCICLCVRFTLQFSKFGPEKQTEGFSVFTMFKEGKIKLTDPSKFNPLLCSLFNNKNKYLHLVSILFIIWKRITHEEAWSCVTSKCVSSLRPGLWSQMHSGLSFLLLLFPQGFQSLENWKDNPSACSRTVTTKL